MDLTTAHQGTTSTGDPALPAPARYLPFASGRYEIKPGLSRLGTDFGNGSADARVFQIDREWPRYRTAKLAARAERFSKYVCRCGLSPALEARLVAWMACRLAEEHPGLFRIADAAGGATALHCALSGETLVFGPGRRLLEVHTPTRIDPPYADALDALACQVQEDLAVVELDARGGDRLTALHLCLPNHWAARDKLGRPFTEVHAPVPHMARIHRRAAPLLAMLAGDGPFLRFTWGLATDTRLNHHPEPPPGHPAGEWAGRRFDPARPELYVRTERQVSVGFRDQRAFLFTIRTCFEDVARLPREAVAALRRAIASMSPEALRYKGIAAQREAIMDWLQRLNEEPVATQ